MDFQKQFDTITGSLNIFDISYLISGAVMFAVLVFAFPEFKDFIFHDSQEILSILACIVVIYVLGMICWLLGKKIRFCVKGADMDDFSNDFICFLDELPLKTKKIEELRSMNSELAYSYMWTQLDKPNNEDYSRRFAYISRFWVLRAIYEGLIPPILLLAAIFWFKTQSLFYVANIKLCHTLVCKVINITFCSLVINMLWIIVVFVLTWSIIRLLCKEAEKCVRTQRREVVIAYYSFFIDETKQTEN